MHCRRRTPLALPIVHLRSTATAVKPKPRNWSIPPPAAPSGSPAPSLGKWARSEPLPLRSTSRQLPEGFGRWPRPTPSSADPSSSSAGRATRAREQPSRIPSPPRLPSGNPGKWAPTSRPSGGFSSGLNKRVTLQETRGYRKPLLRTPDNNKGLQRDTAPHQLLGRSQTDDVAEAVTPTRVGFRRRDSVNRPLRAGRSDVAGLASTDGDDIRLDESSDTWNQDSRLGRHDRGSYKSRGSLVSRIHANDDIFIPNQPRVSNIRSKIDSPKQRKAKETRKSRVEVYIPTVVSVGRLARLLNVRLETLQRKMVEAGMGEEASYDHVLTSDYAVLLAEEFRRKPIVDDEAAFDIYPSPVHPHPSSLPSRPPVVTIMGHVDHGKTTLLDTLRSASVAQGEAGGITQHIGAFSVSVPAGSASAEGPRTITFLDTPGHAAFSAMRARGAGVTDIVVLVVAADDGVMPQTREVIELVKKDEGKTGLVVAINKVDKPGIDIDTVQMALMAEGIQLESLGGDVPSVLVSGLTGQGLNTLVETLSAMAEMHDLRAEREGSVHGYILESKVHKGLGPVATVLVLRGCLTPSSYIISGTRHAKVRVMTDSSGATVKAAYPGMAITVSGWKELPNAGDEVLQASEADVKKAVANRMRKGEVEATFVDVEAINISRREERERRETEGAKAKKGEDVPNDETGDKIPKELRLVIKGDVSGSVEAVGGALKEIGNKEAAVKIVSTGVGDVTESDVMMAKASEGMIVAFSVAVPRAVETIASQNGVQIYSSRIIYRLMDDIKDRVISMLPVTVEKRVTGEATVLQLFDIQVKAKQSKKVAGCRIMNGLAEKTKGARVVRNGQTIHEGSLDTLKYMKKDVTEVRKGSECGLSLNSFDGIHEGDLIQFYEEVEHPGVL